MACRRIEILDFASVSVGRRCHSELSGIVGSFCVPILERTILCGETINFFSSATLMRVSTNVYNLIGGKNGVRLVTSPELSTRSVRTVGSNLGQESSIVRRTLVETLSRPMKRRRATQLGLLSGLVTSNMLRVGVTFLRARGAINVFRRGVKLVCSESGGVVTFSNSVGRDFGTFHRGCRTISIFAS